MTFLVSIPLWTRFDAGSADYQFVEHRAWMPSLGISYHLGIDGISLLLVLLTTFLVPLVLLSAWDAIESRLKEFVVTMLLLETGMLGVFVALDLFLFYIFWEAMLIPMYLIIGVWGGPRRVYAAVKFILYTLAGSLLMLVAILVLYSSTERPPGRTPSTCPPSPSSCCPRGATQDAAVPGLRARVRDQGADVPVPHLAARCPYRGADGGQRDPRRGAARRWARTASCASACRSSRTRASPTRRGSSPWP